MLEIAAIYLTLGLARSEGVIGIPGMCLPSVASEGESMASDESFMNYVAEMGLEAELVQCEEHSESGVDIYMPETRLIRHV